VAPNVDVLDEYLQRTAADEKCEVWTPGNRRSSETVRAADRSDETLEGRLRPPSQVLPRCWVTTRAAGRRPGAARAVGSGLQDIAVERYVTVRKTVARFAGRTPLPTAMPLRRRGSAGCSGRDSSIRSCRL